MCQVVIGSAVGPGRSGGKRGRGRRKENMGPSTISEKNINSLKGIYHFLRIFISKSKKMSFFF